MVQAVLRGIPKASACSSSVWSPISLAASASCLIFSDCRALISDGHISCICPSFSICRWKRRSRSLGIAVDARQTGRVTVELVGVVLPHAREADILPIGADVIGLGARDLTERIDDIAHADLKRGTDSDLLFVTEVWM